jgi:hypothetical protein
MSSVYSIGALETCNPCTTDKRIALRTYTWDYQGQAVRGGIRALRLRLDVDQDV